MIRPPRRVARAKRRRRSTTRRASIGADRLRRDALVLAVGAESMLLSVSPRQRPHVQQIVERWTIDAILAALQILSECRARMRGSLHGRLLVELVLVRIARLEQLTALGSLVDRLTALESGSPAPRRPERAITTRSPLSQETASSQGGPVLAPAGPVSERVVAPSTELGALRRSSPRVTRGSRARASVSDRPDGRCQRPRRDGGRRRAVPNCSKRPVPASRRPRYSPSIRRHSTSRRRGKCGRTCSRKLGRLWRGV